MASRLAVGIGAAVAGAVLGAAVVGGLGVALGYALFADDEPPTGLPDEVEDTRTGLLEAAERGDYDALRTFVSPALSYTFSGPVPGGAIAYWQELERTTGERPLETLAAILRLPYVLSRGIYVWPWAYGAESAAGISEHERTLLAPLGSPDELLAGGTGYIGWRAGVRPDGTWIFFVAGD